jgi:hypothetical protein
LFLALRAGQPATDLATASQDSPATDRLHALAEACALPVLVAEDFASTDSHRLFPSENAPRKRGG